MRTFVVATAIGLGALALGGLGVVLGVGPGTIGMQYAEFPVLVWRRPPHRTGAHARAEASPTPARRRPVRVTSYLPRNDVRDVTAGGETTFVATAGGLWIVPSSQARNPRAGRWLTAADGLPSHGVRAVVADTRGAWVAVAASVARVERDPSGAWSVIAVLEPAVATDEARTGASGKPAPAPIVDLAAGRGGVLAASHGDGAFVVRRCAPAPGLCAQSLPIGRGRLVRMTTSIAAGELGGTSVVMVGTAGAGVVELRATRATRFNAKAGLRADLVTGVALQGDQAFVATVAGLSRYDGRFWHDDRAGQGVAVASGDVLTLDESRLFIRSTRGWRAQKNLDATEIRAAVSDVNGRLVATDNGLLWVPHAANRSAASVSLGGPPSADISSLALSSGRVWIGGFDGGLARFDGSSFMRLASDELDPHINAIRIVPPSSPGRAEEIWVATIGGVYRAPIFRGLPPSEGWTRWGEDDGLPSAHTNTLAVGDDAVWIGTSEGLAVARRDEQGRWRLRRAWRMEHGLPFRILYTAAATADGVWLGGLGGAAHFDGETFETFSYENGQLPDPWVNAVAVEPGGAVWLGTYDQGMARYDGHDWTYYGESERGPASGWVFPNAALALPDGTVWFGTMGGGLVGVDASGWRSLGVRDGLAGNDVTALVYDRETDTLWVGTRTGLSAVTFTDPEAS